MIDYEKLKLAHELCIDTNYTFDVEFGWEDGMHIELYTILKGEHLFLLAFEDIDNLIAKLQELIQPKPKYAVGQKLYFKDDIDEIQSFKVGDIEDGELYRECNLSPLCLHENELFLTRKALIEAQIEYWQRLKLESMTPPFEGEIKGLSACCALHAGTDEECHDSSKEECQHEYQKTLSKNGMYFINLCHKCLDQKPWKSECQHESNGTHYHIQSKFNPDKFIAPIWKCKKCGEYYR